MYILHRPELKKNLLGFSIFILIMSGVSAQRIAPFPYISAEVNYIRTWEAKGPLKDANKILISASVDSFLMTTQYFDGLGRPIQVVAKQLTPLGKDFVTPIVYDDYGREQFKYLPFAANNTGGNTSLTDGLFKINPFQQDSAFSKNQYMGENYFYSHIIFEASPLNRVLETFAPGDSWVGSASEVNPINRRSVKMDYQINGISDSVRIWQPSSSIVGLPTTNSIYPAGELYKIVTSDEHGNDVIEYKDKQNKIILKKVQLHETPSKNQIR